MPRNCWTRCNKTFPCSFPAREKTREIESRETSKRLEKQAILALLRKMIYKYEFVERLAMKKKNPQKNLIISWIVIGAGIFFATIGAVTAQDYKLNLWLWIGFLTIIAGIVYHLVMVKCPYCGHSLVGYRPFPKECPKCHKKFEFEKLE